MGVDKKTIQNRGEGIMGFFQRLMGEEPSLFQQWLHYDDKGSFAEYLINYALKNIPGNQKVLSNVYIPYKGKTSEIDVLLIHEKGIFVFESKNYSGWIFGSLENRYWTQCLPNKQKSRFYNPMMQNKTHIKAVSQFLNIDISQFTSYIIFSQRCELKNVPNNTTKCIILKRPDMLKMLKKDIKERELIYSKEQIDNIYNKLLPLTKVTEEQKKQHIERIKDIKCSNSNTKEENVDNKPKDIVPIEQTKLYKELKQFRLERSKVEVIKPYFIYGNIQLEEIVNKKPLSVAELRAIRGFGDVKCKKYGEDIIKIVRGNI